MIYLDHQNAAGAFAHRPKQAFEHLEQFLGSNGTEDHGTRIVIYSSPASDTNSFIPTIENALITTRQAIYEWSARMDLYLADPMPVLIMGLISEKSRFDEYLKREEMDALVGGLGITHPVRLISLVLTDRRALGLNRPAEIATHEAIHQYVLTSGLCPHWDAWPRWLHEGFAMMGEHLSHTLISKDFQATVTENTTKAIFGSVNTPRYEDWRKIRDGFDLQSFMNRNMLKDRYGNSADYAASWALTHALNQWKKGLLFAEFLNFLQIQHRQPESNNSVESLSSRWIQERLGADWPQFVSHVKSISDQSAQDS